jgi:hypothetical protein
VDPQVFWAASILVAVPVLLHKQSAHIPGSHTEILSGAAAVGSMFAELFMIQSLLVFDPAVQATVGEQPSSPSYNRRAVSCCFRSPRPHSAWKPGSSVNSHVGGGPCFI